MTSATPMLEAAGLLPCPFCGSSPKLHGPQYGLGAWVSCAGCGLEGPTETGVTEAEAIAAWNRRTPAPSTPVAEGIVERDIWEVANQLEGYVGPDTPEHLAMFLLKEGKEAAKLASTIAALSAERDANGLEAHQMRTERDGARRDAANWLRLHDEQEAKADAAETTRDAARANFLTMQGAAETLLKRASIAEAALATAQEALDIIDAELAQHGYAEIGTLRATVRNTRLALKEAGNV